VGGADHRLGQDVELMLNDQFGIINDALMKLGLIAHPLAWTANPDLSMIAVIMVDVWKTTRSCPAAAGGTADAAVGLLRSGARLDPYTF